MTHDELLAKIDEEGEFLVQHFDSKPRVHSALRAVVELHKPSEIADAFGDIGCVECDYDADYKIWNQPYPCPTIQAIEKELK